MSNTAAKINETEAKEPQYTYKQLISQSCGLEQSILRRALSPMKKYTLKQAKACLEAFMHKEVN